MCESILFKIKELECKYKKSKKPVLMIPELEIEKGKLIAILGESGSGKSTFLETLGLMNKTFQKNNNLKIIFHADGKNYDYKKLWKNKSKKVISYVRNNYFSFIFQQTNLMPKFTWSENICLTKMLQGFSKEMSDKLMREKLKQLTLDHLDDNKTPDLLSGGEQQRVAFLRAILPQYTVLFGDEPTGNLDERNSIELMSILHQNTTKNISSIIVTHNINLALKFAHQIIVIRKIGNSDEFYGKITKDYILKCTDETNDNRDWRNASKDKITKKDIKDILKGYYND